VTEIDLDQTVTTNEATRQNASTNSSRAADYPTLDTEIEMKPFWKIPPLHKAQLKALVVIWLGLTTAYVLVGFAIVEWWEPSGGGKTEARLNGWLDAHRTDQRNHIAKIGSAFSNTETKIGLLLILCPLMLWMYRRWHDWAFLAVGLVFEVSVFFTASKVVRRDRPQVEQLDTAPTFSWPSGHIAACVVFYVGLATVVFWNTRSKLSRVVFGAIAVLVPLVVITCRLYLGMHYLTDAIGGVVLGLLTLLIVRHQLIAARGGRPLTDPAP
jgi:membrane-associated phospholipid phosphatase